MTNLPATAMRGGGKVAIELRVCTVPTSTRIPPGDAVVVTNATGALAWVSFAAPAEVGFGFPVLPNSQRTIWLREQATTVSAVIADGGGCIYVESGNAQQQAVSFPLKAAR